MNQDLQFEVKDLMEVSVGTRETYSFQCPLHYDDIASKSDVKGRVEIMRLEEGFNVTIKDVEIDVEFECVRTLKPFIEKIQVSSIDRIFYFDMPEAPHDPNDIYLVDKKRLKIDISEFLRQEIILHFPAIPVDYRGATDLLEKYSNEKELEHKPLAALKDLLK